MDGWEWTFGLASMVGACLSFWAAWAATSARAAARTAAQQVLGSRIHIHQADASRALDILEQACEDQDPALARTALRHWTEASQRLAVAAGALALDSNALDDAISEAGAQVLVSRRVVDGGQRTVRDATLRVRQAMEEVIAEAVRLSEAATAFPEPDRSTSRRRSK